LTYELEIHQKYKNLKYLNF